ncbi:tyrosyl-tRNA synthetase, partial [Phenoliferia sp. Uapishka_3]
MLLRANSFSHLPRELLLRLSIQHSHPSARWLSTSQARRNVIDELEQRGMVADLTRSALPSTSAPVTLMQGPQYCSRAVRKHVDQPTTVYLGVDPSARSLHVGNLLALIGLLHFRLEGHTSIALIGGATGSVGDPSGRSTERNALSADILEANSKAITKQVTGFLERGVPFALSRTSKRHVEEMEDQKTFGCVKVTNNLEWLGGMSLLDFLSTVGKTARISTMLSRESVKSRLDSSSGLSFTEFSYQLLQAFDFLTLHQRHACTIQLGGSDQLGNIMSGVEMIRKSKLALGEEGKEKALGGEQEDPAYGVTMPLLTTAAGDKFGKSAGNAVWLDADMTSPFDFYQFFLRTTDDDVLKYLKIFSFIRVIELHGIIADHTSQPAHRVAQKILAAEATELVHGPEGLRQALAATEVYYGSDLSKLDLASTITSLDAGAFIPSALVRLSKADFINDPIDKLLTSSGLFASKTQARKAIEQGTIQINGVRLAARSFQRALAEEDVLQGGLVVLRSGKSTHKAVLLQ